MINTVLAQAREGFQAPTTEEFNWPCIGPSVHLGPVSFCLNRVALLIILAALITFAFFWVTLRSPKLVPSKRQALGELAVEFVRSNIIYEVMGRQGLRYLPYLTTVFFFIFFGNLLGVIPPFLFSANASLAMPFLLAILTWFIFVIVGVRQHGGWGYFKNTVLPPGVPVFVYPLLTPIEFISVYLVRPLSLMIRLGANMIAGHLILVVFLLGTQYMLGTILDGQFSITNVWAIGSFGMAIVLMAFEVLVAGLQAFIFTILTSVYIASSMEAEH
jgi:F-type H+-transporting ATPase subunit a